MTVRKFHGPDPGTPDLYRIQLDKCLQHHVEPLPFDTSQRIGISMSVKGENGPLHGLRCHPEKGTTGWFIWSGEWSDEDDFFQPLCVAHLDSWAPAVIPFLLLPPGWRFLIAPDGHEDVWYDESVL